MAQRPLAVAGANDNTGTALGQGSWEHVMAVIADSNTHLSTASRAALATAANLASSRKLTVLFLDDENSGDSAEELVEKNSSRVKRVQGQLSELGFQDVSFLEEAIEHSSGKGSVAVGEAADSVGADLVVMSSAAVHDKHVDANLLAEFVPAPVLLLP